MWAVKEDGKMFVSQMKENFLYIIYKSLNIFGEENKAELGEKKNNLKRWTLLFQLQRNFRDFAACL